MRAAGGEGRGLPFVGKVFDESGTEDTGGDGYHADAENGDDGTEETTKGGNRVDVAVSDGRKRRDGPPEAGERVAKLLRLFAVFGVIDEKGRKQHQQEDEDAGGNQFAGFLPEDVSDGGNRLHVAIEFEDSKESNEPDRPESEKVSREDHREPERKDRHEIDDRHAGENEQDARSPVGKVGAELVRGP